MKIAITSTGETLESMVDERFGRAKYFLIIDTESLETTVVKNTENLDLSQGAGTQSGSKIVDSGVSYVLTGHCGPKAFRVLSSAGLKVIVGVSGTVKDAVDAFKRGELVPADNPDTAGHW